LVLGGLVLLGATGFAAAGTPGRGTAANHERAAAPIGIAPFWTRHSLSVSAGSSLTATLVPTTATACAVAALGPYEGQQVGWQFATNGHPLKLTLHTKPDATPGRWRLRASCSQGHGTAPLGAQLVVQVRGNTGGHGLLAEHGALRVALLKLHAQALTGSLAASHTKVVTVSVQGGGRGGGSDPGDDYPASRRRLSGQVEERAPGLDVRRLARVQPGMYVVCGVGARLA
jgi:hypothetical protein